MRVDDGTKGRGHTMDVPAPRPIAMPSGVANEYRSEPRMGAHRQECGSCKNDRRVPAGLSVSPRFVDSTHPDRDLRTFLYCISWIPGSIGIALTMEDDDDEDRVESVGTGERDGHPDDHLYIIRRSSPM